MREGFFIILFIISTSCFGYTFPDTGDESDGACAFGTTSLPKSIYNCSSLTITGITGFLVNSKVMFRVTGDVLITGTLTASADDSTPYGGGYTPNNGPVSGSYPATPTDAVGSGSNEAGGGGGGGHHNSIYPPTAGGSPTVGSNGQAGAAATTSYGDEAFFDFVIYGGAGGAKGQTGITDLFAQRLGGNGGAGGGVIRIIAGGDIVVDGSIIANGGNGQSDDVSSVAPLLGGAGGGGAGGAIYLQSKGDITINGNITALGGSGGIGTDGGGNGGNGAKGRIRLDDYDGMIENSGTIDPPPYTKGVNSDNVYQGALTCGTTTDDSQGPLSFLLGILFLCILFKFQKRINFFLK